MSEQRSADNDAPVRLANRCRCGDCYHPVIGPNTDGEPCDWCRDCGCPSTDHTPMPPASGLS